MVFIKMNNTILFMPFIAFLLINSGGAYTENLNINQQPLNNNTCKLCHILVDTIDHELQIGNKTISDITNIVDDICHMIGGPSGKECSFIVENIKMIVKYLTEGFDSTQVCIKLKLCNQTKTEKNFNSLSLMEQQEVFEYQNI